MYDEAGAQGVELRQDVTSEDLLLSWPYTRRRHGAGRNVPKMYVEAEPSADDTVDGQLG